MDFWITMLAIALVLVGAPFVRCFFKRLTLRRKLRRVCKKKGYSIVPTHKAWFLGSRKKEICDFHLVSKDEVISVKLFQMLRRTSSVYFIEGEEYYCEHRVFHIVSRVGSGLSFSFKTKPKGLPKYDYDFGFLPEWSGKARKKVLLINPACSGYYNYKRNNPQLDVQADIGDLIGQGQLYAQSGLIKYLKNKM
jgi:hypothetical protein